MTIRKRAPKGSMPPDRAGRLILSVPVDLRAEAQRQAERDGVSEAEWWRKAGRAWAFRGVLKK